MNKTYIFSWGGGVNSTAILAMIKLGMLPELTKENTHIVFADTGAEMPYTYEHTTNCLGEMGRDGWKIKVLRPYEEKELYSPRCQDKTLPEYCISKMVTPSRMFRWCSTEYKTIPMKNYRKSLGETTIIIGIAYDEQHRAKELGSEHTYYPLIDHKLTREGCIELSKKAGLPVGKKSGCYFCPFQPKAEWIKLYKEFPEYFKKTENIENLSLTKRKYGLTGETPIKEKIKKWLKNECDQKDMFEENRHCLCEL